MGQLTYRHTRHLEAISIASILHQTIPKVKRAERGWKSSKGCELKFLFSKVAKEDFPGGPKVKNLPVNAGGTGLISGRGRFHILWGN
jgi:hypothetical protein